MKYLLDVNALLAAIIRSHSNHPLLDAWVRGKELVIGPLSKLGFLRIATHLNAYTLKMTVARQALQSFITNNRTGFVRCQSSRPLRLRHEKG